MKTKTTAMSCNKRKAMNSNQIKIVGSPPGWLVRTLQDFVDEVIDDELHLNVNNPDHMMDQCDELSTELLYYIRERKNMGGNGVLHFYVAHGYKGRLRMAAEEYKNFDKTEIGHYFLVWRKCWVIDITAAQFGGRYYHVYPIKRLSCYWNKYNRE